MGDKFSPIKPPIDKTQEDFTWPELNTLGLRITSIEREISNTPANISELEREVQHMNNCNKVQNEHNVQKVNNVVVGNIPGASTFEIAQQWIANHCKTEAQQQPLEVFYKSEYRGIVLAKCTSAADRDRLTAFHHGCFQEARSKFRCQDIVCQTRPSA